MQQVEDIAVRISKEGQGIPIGGQRIGKKTHTFSFEAGVDVGEIGDRGSCATDDRVWDVKVRSGRPIPLPVVLEPPVDAAATQGDDGVSSAESPEHAGSL